MSLVWQVKFGTGTERKGINITGKRCYL